MQSNKLIASVTQISFYSPAKQKLFLKITLRTQQNQSGLQSSGGGLRNKTDKKGQTRKNKNVDLTHLLTEMYQIKTDVEWLIKINTNARQGASLFLIKYDTELFLLTGNHDTKSGVLSVTSYFKDDSVPKRDKNQFKVY